MLGAVNGSIILDIARRNGCMWQLSIPTAPMFEIDTELLRDLPEKFTYINEEGKRTGYWKHAQHPSAKAIWDYLYDNGYVEKGRWINGDTVLKDFYINRYWFKEGDKFCCSGALKYTLEKWMETEEYKRRGLQTDEND